jgi:hypothetical protein
VSTTAKISFSVDDAAALAVLYRQVVADLATVDAANAIPPVGLGDMLRKYGQLAMVLDSPRLLGHLTQGKTPAPTTDLDDLTAFIDQRAKTGQTRLPSGATMRETRPGLFVVQPDADGPTGRIKVQRGGRITTRQFDTYPGSATRQSEDANDEFDGLPLHMLPDDVSDPAWTLVEALQLIVAMGGREGGCRNYVTTNCVTNGRQRGARYSAEAWCEGCVAREAILAYTEAAGRAAHVSDQLLAGYRADTLAAIASLRRRLGFAAPQLHDELWDELERHVDSILSGDIPQPAKGELDEPERPDGRESITVEMNLIVEPKDGCRWAWRDARSVVYTAEDHIPEDGERSAQRAADQDIADAVIGAVDGEEDPADWLWRVRFIWPTGAAWITDPDELDEVGG